MTMESKPIPEGAVVTIDFSSASPKQTMNRGPLPTGAVMHDERNRPQETRADLLKSTAEDDSAWENFLAGMGGAAKGITLGARQILPWEKAPTKDEIDEWREAVAALDNTRGGFWGSLVGNTMATTPLAIAAGSSAPLAAVGGALQAAFAPADSNQQRLLNMGGGAVLSGLGQAAGNKLSGVLTRKPTTTLTPNKVAALEAYKNLPGGRYLLPGTVKGSPGIRSVEDSRVLVNSPFGGGIRGNILENIKKNNAVAARAIGTEGDDLMAPTLNNAYSKMQVIFDRAKDDTPVKLTKLDQRFLDRLSKQTNARMIGQGKSFDGFNAVSDFQSLLNGKTATRRELGDLASAMGDKAMGEFGAGDHAAGRGLLRLKDHLQQKIEFSLPKAERALYHDARGNYRTLKILETGNVINKAGDLIPGNLHSALLRKDNIGYRLGRKASDLYTIAHAAGVAPREMVRPFVPATGVTQFVLPGTAGLATGMWSGLGSAASGAGAIPAMTAGGLTALGVGAGVLGTEYGIGKALPAIGRFALGQHPILGRAALAARGLPLGAAMTAYPLIAGPEAE